MATFQKRVTFLAVIFSTRAGAKGKFSKNRPSPRMCAPHPDAGAARGAGGDGGVLSRFYLAEVQKTVIL